jgi:hypothetical protein
MAEDALKRRPSHAVDFMFTNRPSELKFLLEENRKHGGETQWNKMRDDLVMSAARRIARWYRRKLRKKIDSHIFLVDSDLVDGTFKHLNKNRKGMAALGNYVFFTAAFFAAIMGQHPVHQIFSVESAIVNAIEGGEVGHTIKDVGSTDDIYDWVDKWVTNSYTGDDPSACHSKCTAGGAERYPFDSPGGNGPPMTSTQQTCKSRCWRQNANLSNTPIAVGCDAKYEYGEVDREKGTCPSSLDPTLRRYWLGAPGCIRIKPGDFLHSQGYFKPKPQDSDVDDNDDDDGDVDDNDDGDGRRRWQRRLNFGENWEVDSREFVRILLPKRMFEEGIFCPESSCALIPPQDPKLCLLKPCGSIIDVPGFFQPFCDNAGKKTECDDDDDDEDDDDSPYGMGWNGMRTMGLHAPSWVTPGTTMTFEKKRHPTSGGLFCAYDNDQGVERSDEAAWCSANCLDELPLFCFGTCKQEHNADVTIPDLKRPFCADGCTDDPLEYISTAQNQSGSLNCAELVEQYGCDFDLGCQDASQGCKLFRQHDLFGHLSSLTIDKNTFVRDWQM